MSLPATPPATTSGSRPRLLGIGLTGLASLSVGVVAVGVTSATATERTTISIELDASSRFDIAVAGQVQLAPALAAVTASPTTQPVGPTINLDQLAATPPPTVTQPEVQLVGLETNAGRRGMAALERLDYPWREALAGWTISFHGPRSDVSGLTYFDRREIQLFPASRHSDTQLAHVMAHEVGHVVDFLYVTPSEKEQWRSARGLDGRSWYPSGTTNDFTSPAGDFAEAFASWQIGDNYQARLGGNPTAAQIELLATITAG